MTGQLTERLEAGRQPVPTGSLRSVARGSTANLFGALVTAITTFAVTILVTRGLTPADAGVFFSATSLFLLATTIGQLGTGTGLVYFLSRCRALGRQQLIANYVRVALQPVLVAAVVMAAGIFVFAPQLAELTLSGHATAATHDLRVLACFIPFVGVESVWLAATRGLGTMAPNNLVEQIGRPLLQVLLVAGSVLLSSTGMLGWAWALAYLPAAVVAWWWWRRLSSRLTSPDSSMRVGREFWRFTAPRGMTSVIQVLMQRFDIVLVGALSGAVDAAIYAAATRFIVAGQVGGNAISFAAQPKLGETIAQGDDEATNHLYQASTAWLMLITWPLYLVLIVFGDPLLHVFGSAYSAGSTVLILLSLSMLVATGCGVVDVVLAMAGHTSWNLGNAVLALGVNLGLDLWLIPSHGVVGAAIGWAAAITVRNLAALVQVGLSRGLHPLGRATIATAGLAGAAFLVIPVLGRVALGDTWLALIASLLVGGPAYLVGLWLLRRDLNLDALRRIRRR